MPDSRESRERPDDGISEILKENDLQFNADGKLVWDESSAEFPRNWSRYQKIFSVVLVSWLELYMTAISSSGAASSTKAIEEYGWSKTLGYFAFLTVYLIGQTLGGIFCSPISEHFGRRTVYISANVLFCVSSVIVGAIHSPIAVFFGRFAQGVSAAIPATVAFGSFADLYDAFDRVWVVYAYTYAGMSGLALGPIYAAFVAEYAGWRWIYYISTIVAGVTTIPCFMLRESNKDQLLDRRVQLVKKQTNRSDLEAEGGGGGGSSSLSEFMRNAAFRPLKLLVTEPIVFFCAALCGIAFGLVYGLTEALDLVYTAEPFGFSSTSASLSFIAIIIGEALNVLPRFYDERLMKRRRSQKQRILPETKIRSFAIACPALAIGLWIFAWTIPSRVTIVPWPVSMIGLVCIGFAANDFSYTLFGYCTDSYGRYAASAVAAVSLTRTLAAAVFPLFTTQMYNGLGYNIATSVLAAVATLFAITPIIFLRYGNVLRHKSRVAPADEDCMIEENKHMENGSDGDKKNTEKITVTRHQGNSDSTLVEKPSSRVSRMDPTTRQFPSNV